MFSTCFVPNTEVWIIRKNQHAMKWDKWLSDLNKYRTRLSSRIFRHLLKATLVTKHFFWMCMEFERFSAHFWEKSKRGLFSFECFYTSEQHVMCGLFTVMNISHLSQLMNKCRNIERSYVKNGTSWMKVGASLTESKSVGFAQLHLYPPPLHTSFFSQLVFPSLPLFASCCWQLNIRL